MRFEPADLAFGSTGRAARRWRACSACAGGSGSFSKQFGTAAASLLQAEVVTADGAARIANACTNAGLFWGLKGGGGGRLGVVTRLTLKTHDLPKHFGAVFGTVMASSDTAFKRLTGEFMRFYASSLFNPHSGETVSFRGNNTLNISRRAAGVSRHRGHVPDIRFARYAANRIAQATATLRSVVPQAGSYVSESDYFERDWQDAFWGVHYPRLLAIKKHYDPDGLFFVHHGVNSQAWSSDGFTRLQA